MYRVWIHVSIKQRIVISIESLTNDNTNAFPCTEAQLIKPPASHKENIHIKMHSHSTAKYFVM